LYLAKEFSPAEEQLKGNPRHRAAYMNPKTGRYCDQSKNVALCRGGSASAFANDNPWTGAAPGIAIDEPGVHVARVLFNPREYTITKATPWKSKQGDFTLGSHFNFEIDGVMVGGLRTVSGLESETEVVEYKDGEDRTMHTRPGNHKPINFTVTRDWSNTSEWFKWRQGVNTGGAGGAAMKKGTVKFFNETKGFGRQTSGGGGGVMHWQLEVRVDRIEMK
jgi:phage tail-like protein